MQFGTVWEKNKPLFDEVIGPLGSWDKNKSHSPLFQEVIGQGPIITEGASFAEERLIHPSFFHFLHGWKEKVKVKVKVKEKEKEKDDKP